MATLNPFDLLNGDAPRPVKKVVVEATPAKVVVAPTKAAPATKAATPIKAAPAKPKKPVEMNSSLGLPTDGVKENTRRRGPRRDVPANERQARRSTDRQPRSGYGRHEGEKKMTAGKGNWGKEGELVAAESTESITEVAAVESVEEVIVEELPKRLTLAQYQAGLKKPVVASSAPRQVASVSAAVGVEVVKKPVENVYAPEIVKKTAPVVKTAKKTSSAAAQIDLTKFIAIKAVSSTNEDAPKDRRNGNDRRTDGNDRRGGNDRRDGNDRKSAAPRASTAPAAPKVNLKDERSFPALGKN